MCSVKSAVGLVALPFALSAALEVETGTAYHAARRPATNLTARIDVEGAVPARWTGSIQFRDYFGRTFSVPVDAQGAKASPVRVKLPEPPAMGIWRGTAHLVSPTGAKVEAKGTFAVLDPHPVTPLAPRGSFRIGINYHVTWYWYQEAVRRQTLDALVGLGAKMMRGDLAAVCQVETRENEFHWEQTDAIIDELQKRGIAIDAIISTVPAWARRPEYASVTNGPTWILPMREGIAARYGRALAQRYGTKIEYYEIGNELDLAPASHLTVEQAMARQREFYAGIKAACPQAQVIPSGWALADSSAWMVKQKGFQERFMREAQDVCDFHPVHLHATYANFRTEAMKFLSWRARDGVKLPWYANETAASTCAGQEDSAAIWVWQKPLWAWAHGSVDYIWYNLRATGPDPNNGEHAYGLFTMDMQPRSTAAAFSALTAVFNGQTFDRIWRDTASCQLYAFKNGKSRTLVGWDSYVQAPRAVPVVTDATRCESVDIMGNRHPVPLKGGQAVIQLGRLPVAYVFESASDVKPDAAALNVESIQSLKEVPIVSAGTCPGQPALVLDSMASYKSFCDGNAETEHRLWKGPQDLSAKLFIWKSDTVHARLDVTDDKPVAFAPGSKRSGDHIRVVFNGEEQVLSPKRNEKGGAVYMFDLPWHAVPGPLTLEVYDDDGEGLDGCLGGAGFMLKYL